MEVSPEIYAWLSTLNIIDPFSEGDKNGDKTYYIPENIVESLFEGQYFENMILNLQDAYNNYFNKRVNCSIQLKELVFKEKKHNKNGFASAVPDLHSLHGCNRKLPGTHLQREDQLQRP